jgi:ribonuclease T1
MLLFSVAAPFVLHEESPALAKSIVQAEDAPAIGRVKLSDLPPEALNTLKLIKNLGPFPYKKDGSIFQNRERILPIRERGYYREYTVKSPWRRDRGARRIVAGKGGEFYYTRDHYRSFKRIVE